MKRRYHNRGIAIYHPATGDQTLNNIIGWIAATFWRRQLRPFYILRRVVCDSLYPNSVCSNVFQWFRHVTSSFDYNSYVSQPLINAVRVYVQISIDLFDRLKNRTATLGAPTFSIRSIFYIILLPA